MTLINQIEFTLYFYTFVEGIIEKLLQCRKKTMYYLVLYYVPTYLTKVYLPRYEISILEIPLYPKKMHTYLSTYIYELYIPKSSHKMMERMSLRYEKFSRSLISNVKAIPMLLPI